MRHTTHLMLGSNAEHLLRSIKQYVIKYGDEQANSFFHALLYQETENNGDASFMTAQYANPDENQFVAGIDEMFDVEFSQLYDIPSTNRKEYLQGFFQNTYNTSITINHPGDSSALNLCIYVPLYQEKYWKTVTDFLDAIDSIPQEFNVDLFLLPYDTAFLLEEDVDTLPTRIQEYAECSKTILNSILNSKKTYKSLGNLVLLQNCNAQGISLELDTDSFVRIVGEYALLSVDNYNEMYPAPAQDPDRPVHALGISVLSFDKYYFVQYLLHKAYAYIMDREQVSQTEVDVNKVSRIVQNLLHDNVKVFSKFYEKEIEPRLNKKIEHDDIISQIGPSLNAEIDRLTDEFQSYISDSQLSLPEKKATLAQLLGEDDDLLTGYMFNKNQLIIDDCCRDVLDIFVEYNNKLCLTASQDGSEKDKADVERLHGYASLSSDEGVCVKKASELLDELKATKVTMRESTNYIRQKTLELEALDAQRKDHNESFKRLTNEGFVFEGTTYRLLEDIEEEPFEEEYKPLDKVVPSVDLRPIFTPVKDQGALGACSAFSVVSIFESILKKNNQPDIDLSEQFVYYNARKNDGTISLDKGSSFYSVVQTMSKEGVCLESFHPYNPDKFSQEPPQEAYDDAQNRKVVKALTVKKQVNDIKSAVSEGYPVAFSIRIFDSFDPVKGFIPMPSDDEIARKKSGRHAMVICGYDDESKFFVVRNSWGKKFGINGYCYIPYSYLDNPDLLLSACIITEISNTQLKVKGGDQKTVISFDLTDSFVKTELLTNLIGEEKLKLNKLRKELTERSRAFNILFQLLGNNVTRDSICKGTIERLDWECRHLERDKQEKEKERISALKTFDKLTKMAKWHFGLTMAVVLLSYIVICSLSKVWWKPLLCKPSYILYGLVALSGLFFWLWLRRRKRLREDLDLDFKAKLESLATEISNRMREKEIVHLKTHLAGMIIDSLYKLNQNLHSKYNGMRSYLGNLRIWREQETESLKMSPMTKDPFLTLISNECLDQYFDSNKEQIIKDLELSTMFRDKYKVQESEIIKFKNDLKASLKKVLFDAVKDFSILKYLTKATVYPYVSGDLIAVDALLRQMDTKSNPFVRLNPMAVSADNLNTYCKMMFLHMETPNDRREMDDACQRNFNNKPLVHNTLSETKITVLQLKGIAPNEIGMLN